MKHTVVLLLLITFKLHSQIDTNYIKQFPKALTIKPYIDYKLNGLNISDDKSDGEVNYQTAQAPRIGIGASYKWMSFLTAIAPIYKGNKAMKGASTQMDIQWNIYLKALSTDLRYQQYEGYYLKNSSNLLSWNMDENGYYKREDLKVKSIGANIRYNFNSDQFSQKAAFSQTEQQLKSAGSFCLGIRWNLLDVHADSSFIPSTIDKPFVDFSVNHLRIYDQGIGVGYSYSFVHKNWFANLTVMPFFIFQILEISDVNNKKTSLNSAQFILQSRGAIGYNGKKDYCGITFVSNQMRSRWKDAHDIGYDFANIKLFYARRIQFN